MIYHVAVIATKMHSKRVEVRVFIQVADSEQEAVDDVWMAQDFSDITGRSWSDLQVTASNVTEIILTTAAIELRRTGQM